MQPVGRKINDPTPNTLDPNKGSFQKRPKPVCLFVYSFATGIKKDSPALETPQLLSSFVCDGCAEDRDTWKASGLQRGEMFNRLWSTLQYAGISFGGYVQSTMVYFGVYWHIIWGVLPINYGLLWSILAYYLGLLSMSCGLL